jgi:hypothetical protein
MLSLRRFGRTVANLLSIAMVFIALSLGSNGQETEHVDPLETENLKNWYQSSFPVPYGVIVNGSIPLMSQTSSETEGSIAKSMSGGLMVYYDTWQAALDLSPNATYVRLMPRSVGRDEFVAAVFEVGFASKEENSNDGSEVTTTVLKTRYGIGGSMRSRIFSGIPLLFLADASAGFGESVSDFYFRLQLGALLRVSLGGTALQIGPYYGIQSGLGLHIAAALNLNRPQILTGAE